MNQVNMDLLHDIRPQGAYTELDKLLRLRFIASELSLFARRPSSAQISGSVRTRFRGRGMEFEEVRLYQAGDDIRSIDWRVTARTQVAHTKLYREERERPVFVMIDQRSPMFFGSQRCFKSVYAAHIAALTGWAALSNSDRIGALVFGDRTHRDIRPKRSKHALMELIHQVHEFNHLLTSPVPSQESLTLKQMLTDVTRISKPGSAVFLVSDFHDFDAESEKLLFQLGRHTDVTLFHLYDQLEHSLPEARMLTVSNGEKRLQLNTRAEQLKTRYADSFKSRVRYLEKTCNSLAVPLISIDMLKDPVHIMRSLYGRKGKR